MCTVYSQIKSRISTFKIKWIDFFLPLSQTRFNGELNSSVAVFLKIGQSGRHIFVPSVQWSEVK
jgi:hypothetical protein